MGKAERMAQGYGWALVDAMRRRERCGGERRGGGAFFGADGVFGPRGPFGPDGPFGPNGPFGSGGSGAGWQRQYGEQGRGSRRRGRMFGQGELRLLLLKLIGDEARHGYELIKAIEDMTGGSYAPSPGTVYPTLALLEDEGIIRKVAGGEDARKAFEVTPEGRSELERRAQEATDLIERLSDLGARHAEHGRAFATPEMFRALGNLAQVVRNKARSGTLEADAVARIVDLIDEMARKIERL